MAHDRKAAFVKALMGEFSCAFVTVYDDKDGSVICEGSARSLMKILDFGTLPIRSFYILELEDGGVQADIRVRARGRGPAA